MPGSLDFAHDQFANVRRSRIPNIVNDVARECLATIPDISIPGRRVRFSANSIRQIIAAQWRL
jgi:hypothetical protein